MLYSERPLAHSRRFLALLLEANERERGAKVLRQVVRVFLAYQLASSDHEGDADHLLQAEGPEGPEGENRGPPFS